MALNVTNVGLGCFAITSRKKIYVGGLILLSILAFYLGFGTPLDKTSLGSVKIIFGLGGIMLCINASVIWFSNPNLLIYPSEGKYRIGHALTTMSEGHLSELTIRLTSDNGLCNASIAAGGRVFYVGSWLIPSEAKEQLVPLSEKIGVTLEP